jgi:hypothetical protein
MEGIFCLDVSSPYPYKSEKSRQPTSDGRTKARGVASSVTAAARRSGAGGLAGAEEQHRWPHERRGAVRARGVA